MGGVGGGWGGGWVGWGVGGGGRGDWPVLILKIRCIDNVEKPGGGLGGGGGGGIATYRPS